MVSSLLHKPDTNAPVVGLYCERVSPRLIYTCDFIFNQVLQLHYKCFDHLQDFQNHQGIKINLSASKIERSLQVALQNLIFENTLSQAVFSIEEKNATYVLMQSSADSYQKIELDLFSSVFYFISRHEEWCNQKSDQHNRFEVEASVLFQNQLYLKPLVDIWINDFKKSIQNYFSEIQLPPIRFKIISTIDVDNVFAFNGKPLVRVVGGLLKDVLRMDTTSAWHRIQTLLFNKKDPFDIYEHISNFCQAQNVPLTYFFLFKTGTKYDRSLDPNAKVYQTVFEEIKRNGAHIALHPSYNSAFDFGLLKHEKELLEKRSYQKIEMSRQHFLRFDIKSTPHKLIQEGIKVDFTMGFASAPGFRAGTSHPFYFYDFSTETQSELSMMPFCAMDGAYTHYQPMPAETAYKSMFELAQEIKNVGGYFTFVYHERSFYDHLYKDYGDLYKKIILALK